MPHRPTGFVIPPALRLRLFRSSLSLALLGLGMAAAQTIQLQGRLQDRYTAAPIEGAEVTLVLQGMKTKTDAAGRFELSRIPTRVGSEKFSPALVRLTRGSLVFRSPQPALFTVHIVDAQGKFPMRSLRADLGEGEWTFHPGKLPQGLYFLSLESQGSRAVVRLPILENVNAGSMAPGFARAAATGASTLAKAAAAALDSLRFSKAGYLTGTEPLLSLNQTGMIAQLKDSGSTQSILTALALANVPLQPPFQSGIPVYRAVVRESLQTLAFDLSTGIAEPDLMLLGNGDILSSTATPMPLNFGMNTLEIRSTSQDGASTTTYSVNIHRARDTASSLRNLSVGGGSATLFPAFDSETLAYKVQLIAGILEASLTANWDEPLASVRINGILQPKDQVAHTATFPLSQDSTRVTVEVRSPNGLHTSMYTVDFLREPPPPPPPPPSAGLASVKTSLASTLFPAWSPATTGYRFDMKDTATTLQITYTPNNPEAFIKAGTSDWQQGTVIESLPYKGSPNYFNHPVMVRNGTDTTRYTFSIASLLSKDADLNHITASPQGSGPTYTRGITLEWTQIFGALDSVVDIKPITQSPYAKLVYDGKVVPYNTIIRLALNPGNNRFAFTITSQEGSTSRTMTLNFGRVKPKTGVTPPAITGPDRGFIQMPYIYAFTPSSETCLYGMTYYSRISWGDGTTQYKGGNEPPSTLPFGTHIWKTPGTFTVKAINFCAITSLTLPGDTSAPITVQIADTSNGGKVRSISGPRMASETWHPDTLYKITGSALFETGTTLTILPGTTVLFHSPAYPSPSNPPYYIAVQGELSAVGTATDSIRFVGGGSLRPKWPGPLTYNPDGSYKAGPRFEYVTFQDGASLYLEGSGGYGFYMKNSRVPLVTAEFSKYARGSYIEKSRFGDLANVQMDNSRILNSYFNVLSVNAGGSSTLVVDKCDIKSLNLGYYSSGSDLIQLSGNTIGTVNGGWSAVEMHGNNILGTPLGVGFLAYKSMGTAAVNLQDNYWGEAVTAEMTTKGANQNISVISDYFDDVATGKADYSLWKTAPVPNAKPDW